MTKKITNYNKEYYSRPEIKKSHSDYMKKYYLRNREKLLKKQSDYYINNKHRISLYMRKYMRTYKKSDVKFGKDVIDPESKVVDILDTDEIGTVTDDKSKE